MRTRSYDCLTVVLLTMLYAVHAWVGATHARYDFVYTRHVRYISVLCVPMGSGGGGVQKVRMKRLIMSAITACYPMVRIPIIGTGPIEDSIWPLPSIDH